MNNTYTIFPQVGVREGEKVAKLSGEKKENLVLKYNKALETLVSQQEIKNTPVVEKTEVKTRDYTSLTNKIGITTFENERVAVNDGARKLKVNPLVNRNVLNYYEATKISRPKEEVKKVQEVVHEEMATVHPVMPPVKEDIVAPKEEKVSPIPEPSEANVETRMSRLEKTMELPVGYDYRTDLRQEPVVNDVINTPSRFERKKEEIPVNDYRPLEESRNISSLPTRNERKMKEERPSGPDLDRIYNLTHGGEVNNLSVETLNINKQTSQIVEENKELEASIIEFERKLADKENRIKKLQAEKDRNIREEHERAVKAQKDAEAERLQRTQNLTYLKALLQQREIEEATLEQELGSIGRTI